MAAPDLLSLPCTTEDTIDLLRSKNLLKSNVTCCGTNSHLNIDSKCSDGIIWKCYTCKKKKSIRDGSFFQNSHLSLVKLLHIIFLFAANVSVTAASKLLKGSVSRKGMIQWYAYIRDICSHYLVNNDFMLGGRHTVFVSECDESMLGSSRKYNRGYIRGIQQWIFAAVCRTSKLCKIRLVDDRKRTTLDPIITSWITPHSTIHTDQARVYTYLSQTTYTHHTVCHKENFVDPVTGTHTNNIENVFSNLKAHLKAMRGVYKTVLPAHIDEFLYRWNRPKLAGTSDIFELLLQDIAAVYH